MVESGRRFALGGRRQDDVDVGEQRIDDGATMFMKRISTVSAKIGIVTTMTWLVMFQGSSLNLKKISQTMIE